MTELPDWREVRESHMFDLLMRIGGKTVFFHHTSFAEFWRISAIVAKSGRLQSELTYMLHIHLLHLDLSSASASSFWALLDY